MSERLVVFRDPPVTRQASLNVSRRLVESEGERSSLVCIHHPQLLANLLERKQSRIRFWVVFNRANFLHIKRTPCEPNPLLLTKIPTGCMQTLIRRTLRWCNGCYRVRGLSNGAGGHDLPARHWESDVNVICRWGSSRCQTTYHRAARCFGTERLFASSSFVSCRNVMRATTTTSRSVEPISQGAVASSQSRTSKFFSLSFLLIKNPLSAKELVIMQTGS